MNNNIRNILEKYEDDFLDNFNINYDILKLETNKDNGKINIMLDFNSIYTSILSNENIYIVYSEEQLDNILEYFYNRREVLEYILEENKNV